MTVAAVLLVGVAAALIWSFRHSPEATLEFKQVTTLIPENRATAAAISPDGGLLAYANVDGIFLRVIKSGETNPLNGPRDFLVDQIAWLPDGDKMIASGFSEETNQPAIWSVSITGGKAHELRKDSRFGAVSPDGSRLAFLSGDYSSIWTMALDGEEPREILRSPQEDTFLSVLWSSEGRYLQTQRRHYSGKLDYGFVMFDRFYERSFESVNAETGTVVGTLPNLWVQSAAILPNGRLLLLRMAPPGAANPNETEFWETAIDPISGKFLGSLQKSAMRAKNGEGRVVGVSTTADGASVMILREREQAAVFVADFNPVALRFSHARRLTLDERSNYPHAWTADSGSVIFESNRNGTWDLFRQRVDERVPDVLVATQTRSEVLPQLSADGKHVLYASGPTTGNIRPFTLMSVPLEGGPPQHVETNGPLDEFRCSLRRNGRCVVRTTVNRDYFVYSELDPVRGIGRELARTAWQESLLWDWDVSPDGALLAVPNHDSRSARVRIIRLGTQPNVPQERELNLPGLTNISGLVWAADGGGWFITVFTSVGKRILHCDLEGRIHSIGDINGWVVPAPDGKRVAYLNTMLETNAWTAKRR